MKYLLLFLFTLSMSAQATDITTETVGQRLVDSSLNGKIDEHLRANLIEQLYTGRKSPEEINAEIPEAFRLKPPASMPSPVSPRREVEDQFERDMRLAIERSRMESEGLGHLRGEQTERIAGEEDRVLEESRFDAKMHAIRGKHKKEGTIDAMQAERRAEKARARGVGMDPVLARMLARRKAASETTVLEEKGDGY